MTMFNFTNAVEVAENGGEFPVLDPGEYLLEVKEATFGTSSKGNPMITATFVEPETKTHMRNYFTLTDKAIFSLVAFTKAAGVKMPEGEVDLESDDFKDWVEGLVGAEATAVVETSEYTYPADHEKAGQTTTNNRIKSFKEGKPKAVKKKRTL